MKGKRKHRKGKKDPFMGYGGNQSAKQIIGSGEGKDIIGNAGKSDGILGSYKDSKSIIE